MGKIFGKSPADLIGTLCFLSTDGFNNKMAAEDEFQLMLRRQNVSGDFSITKKNKVNLRPYL